MSDPVKVWADGSIGHLMMSRPDKANSLSTSMREQLCAGLKNLDADSGIDVIVLSGEGPAFSSGGDLREHGPSTMTIEQAWTMLASGVDLTESLEGISKLVVARIQGPAHAGGLLLSLCADITVAARTARFRCPELLRGRPDPFIPLRLTSKVGRERAADLMYTAKEIDGVEAERIGLIARCVDEAELDAEVGAVVAAIQRTDRASRAVWKRTLHELRPTPNVWDFAPYFTSEETANRSYHWRSNGAVPQE